MPCPKHLPMAEKCPAHHQFFFGSTDNRSKRLPEKKAPFLPISGCYFGHFVKNFGYFGGPKKPKNSKFRPILAKKQHLLKKVFHQFFVCLLENIHRNFDDHTTNTGWAISMGGLRPTDRNCLVFSSPWCFAISILIRKENYCTQSQRFLKKFSTNVVFRPILAEMSTFLLPWVSQNDEKFSHFWPNFGQIFINNALFFSE